ncbi:unnamed protein product [Prorocentrum cordatum]|uniref:Uncharacterized protein n=1 Tax=Prorocentrum cordatum TaxID=2364126 RepID=A0ABN9V9H0_9DINO|nr:unnamed protein product [Polarella glacialis]
MGFWCCAAAPPPPQSFRLAKQNSSSPSSLLSSSPSSLLSLVALPPRAPRIPLVLPLLVFPLLALLLALPPRPPCSPSSPSHRLPFPRSSRRRGRRQQSRVRKHSCHHKPRDCERATWVIACTPRGNALCRGVVAAPPRGPRPRSPHPTLQQCTQWRTADDSLVLGEDLVTWRGYVDEQTVAEWFLGSLGFDLVSKNYWADRPQREHTYYWREWDYLAQVEANHFCGGFCEPGPSLFVDYDLSGRQGGKCAPLVGLKFGVVQYQAQLVLWTRSLLRAPSAASSTPRPASSPPCELLLTSSASNIYHQFTSSGCHRGLETLLLVLP